MKLATVLVCSLILSGTTAMAQRWEFGGGVGVGFYTNQDIKSGDASVKAKFKSNLATSIWIGQNARNKWGGEFRYSYQRGNASLNGQGMQASFGAESHSIAYDILWHANERDSPVRPYLAFGGGLKIYRGTGTEVLYQPLQQYGLLTKTQGVYGMVSVGAGVKVKLAPRWQLRFDVHDYITPFPKKVIQPSAGASVGGGWMNDIVPMVGIAFTDDN